MKLHSLLLVCVASGGLSTSLQAQDCDPKPLEVGKELQLAGAAGLKVAVQGGETSELLPDPKPTAGALTLNATQLGFIDAFVKKHAAERVNLRLVATDTSGAPRPAMIQFLLPGEKKEQVCGSEADAAATKIATPNDCLKVAHEWSNAKGAYRVPILFNRTGALCYSPPVIRQGDLLVSGLVLTEGEEAPRLLAEYPGCKQEVSTPLILVNGAMPSLKFQSTADETFVANFLGAHSCGMASPVITVKEPGEKGATLSSTTLNQYPRHQAAFHFGAVYSSLHSPDFALRDNNGTNVIVNKEADERGPEYVAALVLQGLPNYFARWFGRHDNPDALPDTSRWSYKGRDMIHDGDWRDRLGLVVSAGLEKPGERFGVGLSFEIANGVNLMALYEAAKLRRLDGVALGDAFTGTADAIPTRKEWEKKASLGLTFDLTYVTQLFGGKKAE